MSPSLASLRRSLPLAASRCRRRRHRLARQSPGQGRGRLCTCDPPGEGALSNALAGGRGAGTLRPLLRQRASGLTADFESSPRKATRQSLAASCESSPAPPAGPGLQCQGARGLDPWGTSAEDAPALAGIMSGPCNALQLILATTLQVLSCTATMLRPQDNGTHPSGEVIRWMEVYNRSFCQPKETMVPVSAEHPGEVEHILVPSCVAVRRCAGCCADEELQCVPVQMHVVVMEVMKTRFPRSRLGQMPFVEHSACECRPKKLVKDQRRRPPCPPCLDRRRQLDPQTCECHCRRRPQRCRARGLELNQHSCRCEKLRR